MEYVITSIVTLVSICCFPLSLKVRNRGYRTLLLACVMAANIALWMAYDNVSMMYLAIIALLLLGYTWMKKAKSDETDGNNSQL
ncbi:MAG: hypothetical protein IJ549_02555 [Prevotella sp.]|nr:hypothetical protein [Prevotella sp.]